jgi:hypothetical protein
MFCASLVPMYLSCWSALSRVTNNIASFYYDILVYILVHHTELKSWAILIRRFGKFAWGRFCWQTQS